MKGEKFYKTPKPVNLTKGQINDLAEEVASILDFKPGEDIEKVVKSLGGEIEYVGLERWYDTDSGSIKIDGEGDFKIFVSNFTGPLRDRFTIAHELGHYFLHSNMGKKKIKVARSGDNKRVEWEANWFAAGFLMPQKIFIEKYKNERLDIPALSKYFLVSQDAVNVRIRDLEEIG